MSLFPAPDELNLLVELKFAFLICVGMTLLAVWNASRQRGRQESPPRPADVFLALLFGLIGDGLYILACLSLIAFLRLLMPYVILPFAVALVGLIACLFLISWRAYSIRVNAYRCLDVAANLRGSRYLRAVFVQTLLLVVLSACILAVNRFYPWLDRQPWIASRSPAAWPAPLWAIGWMAMFFLIWTPCWLALCLSQRSATPAPSAEVYFAAYLAEWRLSHIVCAVWLLVRPHLLAALEPDLTAAAGMAAVSFCLCHAAFAVHLRRFHGQIVERLAGNSGRATRRLLHESGLVLGLGLAVALLAIQLPDPTRASSTMPILAPPEVVVSTPAENLISEQRFEFRAIGLMCVLLIVPCWTILWAWRWRCELPRRSPGTWLACWFIVLVHLVLLYTVSWLSVVAAAFLCAAGVPFWFGVLVLLSCACGLLSNWGGYLGSNHSEFEQDIRDRWTQSPWKLLAREVSLLIACLGTLVLIDRGLNATPSAADAENWTVWEWCVRFLLLAAAVDLTDYVLSSNWALARKKLEGRGQLALFLTLLLFVQVMLLGLAFIDFVAWWFARPLGILAFGEDWPGWLLTALLFAAFHLLLFPRGPSRIGTGRRFISHQIAARSMLNGGIRVVLVHSLRVVLCAVLLGLIVEGIRERPVAAGAVVVLIAASSWLDTRLRRAGEQSD